MASIGDLVQAQSGVMYDKDSPQGKMIINAQKRAVASAAESNSFTANSSALNTTDISPVLHTIASDVEIIRDSVNQLVVIAEADARGDALGSANVTEDATVTAMTGDGGTNVVSDAESAEKAGELGGLAGMIGGLGMGMQFWGTKKAVIGVPVFLGFLLGLIGVGYVGAKVFRASVEDIAEGMEHLSDADVDTDKVIAMGEALAKFGLAMSAQGLGAGLQGLGTLVGGIAEGLAGFLGIEGKDPMVALKEFSQHDISEEEVKQIELNAKALTAFSGAMTVAEVGGAVQSVANLVSGVADGLAGLFPAGSKPMDELVDFASYKITDEEVDQITRNALALVGFSTTMATVESIGVVEDIAKLASGVVNGMASLFPKDVDPMIKMRAFADHKFTDDDVDQIKLNAGALLAFSSTMAASAPLGTVAAIGDLFTGIATGVSKFFGLEKPVPMEDMRAFASHKFTQDEVDQIELNAGALVNFSKAMALYSGANLTESSLNLVSNLADGIVNFFGGTTGIDYEEIKTFANSGIGEYVDDIDDNLKVIESFLDFSTAVRDFEGVDFKHVNAFSSGLVTASHGISYALHGGAKKFEIPGFFNDITIKPGEGLASIESFDMQNAAQGIAVLRHSLSAEAPLEALKEAAAVMNTTDGTVTVVNAPVTTTTSNVKQGDTVISELGVVDANQMYMQDAFMSSMPSLR